MEAGSSILYQLFLLCHEVPPFLFKTYYFFFPFKVVMNLGAMSHWFYTDANFLLLRFYGLISFLRI